MAQAFLHREQHIGVAARLDMDHPVGMEAGKAERRGEQVAPAQAPEHRPIDPRQDSREEDGGGRIVAKLRATSDFVKRAAGESAARQVTVYAVQPERNAAMAGAHPLDLRDTRTQMIEEGCGRHNINETREAVDSFLLCSP